MQINWDEIQEAIEDKLEIFTSLGEVAEILQEKLDFSEEEALDISGQMWEEVEDAEDQIKSDLANDLIIYLKNLVKERDPAKEIRYPEDAPGQMHLYLTNNK